MGDLFYRKFIFFIVISMMNDEFSLLFKMAVINTRIFIPINSLVKRVDATALDISYTYNATH